MRKGRVILSSVGCPAVQYFSALSHKRQELRRKMLLDIKYVFWFSLQLLHKIFLILRRIERDIKNVYWSPCKVAVTLVGF